MKMLVLFIHTNATLELYVCRLDKYSHNLYVVLLLSIPVVFQGHEVHALVLDRPVL